MTSRTQKISAELVDLSGKLRNASFYTIAASQAISNVATSPQVKNISSRICDYASRIFLITKFANGTFSKLNGYLANRPNLDGIIENCEDKTISFVKKHDLAFFMGGYVLIQGTIFYSVLKNSK